MQVIFVRTAPQEAIALSLSFSAYAGESEQNPTAAIQAVLELLEPYIGTFRTVWGPAWHTASALDDALAYIVQNAANPAEYYLVIRGTNTRSLSSWLWQDLAVDNVGRMIRRDWNHPSIILWGVRINESLDSHDFYLRTNALAHKLDTSRQTGGIRYFQGSEFLEDVFTMNDFGWPLQKPNHPLYLNTEFVGHTYPTKTIDNIERLREHTVRHARIHDQLASDAGYAGGIGWCAFDYNTHANFGSGDRICYHGVMDMWREPKPAAGFYRSQCDPDEEVVLVPAFHWARGDENIGFTSALVSSNCDHLKFYVKDKLVAEVDPDKAQFPNLKYAPFTAHIGGKIDPWGDLKIEGYIKGELRITRRFSGKGLDQKFTATPDDHELVADGADVTRVVLRVTDEFDAIRPFAADPIRFELTGPATLIGDNPFVLQGGQGAVWIRAGEEAGPVKLTAHHPTLGKQTVELTLKRAEPERA